MSEQYPVSSPYVVWHPPTNTTTPTTPQANEQSRNYSNPNGRKSYPLSRVAAGSRGQHQDQPMQKSWHKFQYMLDQGSQAMSYDINQFAMERIFTEVCIELENDPKHKNLDTWEIELLADPIARERFFDEDFYTEAGHPSLSAAERNR